MKEKAEKRMEGLLQASMRSTKIDDTKQVERVPRDEIFAGEDCWRSKCRSQGLVGRSSEVHYEYDCGNMRVANVSRTLNVMGSRLIH